MALQVVALADVGQNRRRKIFPFFALAMREWNVSPRTISKDWTSSPVFVLRICAYVYEIYFRHFILFSTTVQRFYLWYRNFELSATNEREACGWRIAISPIIPCDSPPCYHSSMRHVVVLFVHFIATLARFLGPGGVRSLVAEPLPYCRAIQHLGFTWVKDC